MVSVGDGEYRVGTPEDKSPIQAGISKQSPAAITIRRAFISSTHSSNGTLFQVCCKNEDN